MGHSPRRRLLPEAGCSFAARARISEQLGHDAAVRSGSSTFLQVADYYLVAHALAHGHTVVTHEVPAPSRKRIKIPNACIDLGVKCMTPYEMLRVERARFVLGPTG
jgi:hypothetical protein